MADNIRTPDYVQLAQQLGFTRVTYGPEEVCDLLGVGRELVDGLIAKGELKASKLGGRVLIPAIELARLLQVRQIDPASRAQPKPRDPRIKQRQRFTLPESGES
jgi:excisionase family DNA binding protein